MQDLKIDESVRDAAFLWIVAALLGLACFYEADAARAAANQQMTVDNCCSVLTDLI
ncbi:MAG: hypothetical protein PHC51_05250 [bacterium]|nr:hypothetical protein [bacterium]